MLPLWKKYTLVVTFAIFVYKALKISILFPKSISHYLKMASNTLNFDITHQELCEVMRDSDIKFTDQQGQLLVLERHVFNKLKVTEQPDEDCREELKKVLQVFLWNVVSRYKKVHFSFTKLEKKSAEFMSHKLAIPESLQIWCERPVQDEKRTPSPEKKTPKKEV